MLDATHLRCISPAAADAGVVPLRSEEFGAPPVGATLHGTAKIEGGTLRLTPVEGVGSLSLELPNMGGNPNPKPRPIPNPNPNPNP